MNNTITKSFDISLNNLNKIGIMGEKIDNILKGQNEIKFELKEINIQTQKTNSRVTKLETWKTETVKWIPRYVLTSFFFIGIILSLATYIYLEDKKRLPFKIITIKD